MVNNNNNLINNKKPIESVQELEKYEIKKSPLSPAARGKVINKGGSSYVSEDKKSYGPCSISGCPYPNRCFYLRIGFSLDPIFDKPRWAFESSGSTFQWITMNNIEEAREVLKKFSNKCYKVINKFKIFDEEDGAQRKQEVVLSKIRTQISLHSRGENVYEANLDLYKVTDVDRFNFDYNRIDRSKFLTAVSAGLNRGEIDSDIAFIVTKRLMEDES